VHESNYSCQPKKKIKKKKLGMVLVASLFTYFHSWNACRMYQALLASGDNKSAKIMLNKIPKDDHHVRCVIKACERSYIVSNSNGCMKKKKKKGKT
jgi:hypothetical protein